MAKIKGGQARWAPAIDRASRYVPLAGAAFVEPFALAASLWAVSVSLGGAARNAAHRGFGQPSVRAKVSPITMIDRRYRRKLGKQPRSGGSSARASRTAPAQDEGHQPVHGRGGA